jgi:hypothetical protein
MNPDTLEQLRRLRRRKLPDASKVIRCPHRKHIILRSDTVIRFPVRKYDKKLKSQGKKMTLPTFRKLVALFGAGPPKDMQQRYHCEIITTYQKKTNFWHVIKV